MKNTYAPFLFCSYPRSVNLKDQVLQQVYSWYFWCLSLQFSHIHIFPTSTDVPFHRYVQVGIHSLYISSKELDSYNEVMNCSWEPLLGKVRALENHVKVDIQYSTPSSENTSLENTVNVSVLLKYGGLEECDLFNLTL